MMFSETPIVVQVRLAVGGVDEDPGDRTGALARVEHPHPVVGQVDAIEGRELGPDGAAQRGVEGVDRAVALGGGDDPLPSDVDLHRGLGRHAEVGALVVAVRRSVAVVGDDPEGLDREEVRRPSGGPPQQQLERAVGHLEVVALVLEPLELVEHAAR